MARALLCVLASGFMVTAILGGCGDDDGMQPIPVTGLVIAEDSLNLDVCQSTHVTATVSGGDTKSVAWYVNGILGGNATLGTITQANPATFTAPGVIPEPATVVVRGVSQEDTAKHDSCRVTIRFTTIHVDVATGSDETGTGCVTKAFKTIAKGLDAAQAGMTVEVAEGTYEEHDIMMKSGVALRSETGEAGAVVVDAKGLGRVFECEYTDTNTVIQGFTITGGDPVGPGYDVCGGGVRCKAGTGAYVKLVNCMISGNHSACGGGFACMQGCSTDVFNCAFIDNACDGYGGAIYYIAGGNGTFLDCIFFGNSSLSKGGAILTAGQFSLEVTGCTFCANSAAVDGGGMYMNSRDVIFENTIIAFSGEGEAIYIQEEASIVTLSCCDIYGNEDGDWTGELAAQLGVDGNFSADPRFCELGVGDLYLQSCSPCLPGNHPDDVDCGLIGAWGQGCPCD